jgi:hypothetical protein
MTRVGKAYFQRLKANGSAGPKLKVQFNPTEYTVSKGNHIAEVPIPGLDSPILQFVRGQNETISLDLFFDSTEDGMTAGAKPVTTLTDKFYDLIKMESKTHAPPILLFSWGGPDFPGKDRPQFTCICESVRQRYTLFDPAGVPLRATLSVTLKEYRTLGGQQNAINPMSSDHTKAHVTRDGETLAQVAYDEYDDPAAWRRIADANDLDDPAVIPAGAVLTIPRGDT